MNKTFALSLAIAASIALAGTAHAATTVTMGTNGSWTITDGSSNPLSTFTPTNSQIPGSWSPSDANSQWISPALGSGASFAQGGGTSPAGLYSYTGVFQLSNIGNVQTNTVTWWADNILRTLIINGQTIFSNRPGGALSQEFVNGGITETFTNPVWQNGSNTVTFIVENGPGASGNPTGLRALMVSTSVPEPGTWMLMILGLGAIGFAMRRRQNASVNLQFA